LKIFVEKSRHWRSLDFVIELRESTILDMLERDACSNMERAALRSRYWGRETLDTLWAKLHHGPSPCQVSWYRYFQDGLSLGHNSDTFEPYTNSQIHTSVSFFELVLVFIPLTHDMPPPQFYNFPWQPRISHPQCRQ
jgi:hypothetical protein